MLLWSQQFWDAQAIGFSKLVSTNQEIYLTSKAEVLQSGFVGPFGGPKPDMVGLCLNSIEEILLDSINFARLSSKNYFEIKLPPRNFYPDFIQATESILVNLGFSVKSLDTNSSIRVSDFSEVSINRNRRRDLAFWRNSDAIYVNEQGSLEEVFSCISLNRKIRGITPTSNLEFLLNLRSAIGSQFTAHSVLFSGKVVCAAIVLKLDDETQYVYMWGDNPSIRAEHPSPLVFLFEKIVESFTKNSPVRICLGTSSIDGKIDEPLLQFKTSLGFQNSLKPTYILGL